LKCYEFKKKSKFRGEPCSNSQISAMLNSSNNSSSDGCTSGCLSPATTNNSLSIDQQQQNNLLFYNKCDDSGLSECEGGGRENKINLTTKIKNSTRYSGAGKGEKGGGGLGGYSSILSPKGFFEKNFY
jgi:hypothetical protein